AEIGWSRDPVTRLSVAAQALQCDDQFAFGGSSLGEPVVWKNRGKVRLPLRASQSGPRPAPIQGFRAVLRELGGPAAALVEEAAQGAQLFEARVLWPRILARLLAARFPLPEGGEPPIVQARAEEWRQAADSLREMAGPWAPRIA